MAATSGIFKFGTPTFMELPTWLVEIGSPDDEIVAEFSRSNIQSALVLDENPMMLIAHHSRWACRTSMP